jgi:hypothetical protein
MKRFLSRIVFFLLPVPFFAVCLAMLGMDGIFGNVDPENMDRQTLVRVMQLRDFRRFSPDLVERLTHRAVQEFGRHSPRKPTFELPYWEKNVHTYFQTQRSSQPSFSEINLAIMTKTCYFQWMYEYQSATSARKGALMNDVVEDMRYWQTIYYDYIRVLGLPEPSLAELQQEFERTINGFKVGASPEEIVMIDSFAKDMNRALFFVEVRKSIMDLFSLPAQK